MVGSPQIPVAAPPKRQQRINVDELAKLHPGFRQGRSIVLPRFGSEPEFDKWHPENSLAIEALAVPQPFQAVQDAARVDVQSELHPLFKAGFDALLRRFGVKLEVESGAVPQSAAAPVAVSRTVIMERPATVSRTIFTERAVDQPKVPYEVWRQGDEVARLWSIGQSLLETA